MKRIKGISLIVLVITIIVMIVLAGAIVLTISNSGIIDKAAGAVGATNLAAVKEITQMAWAEAYADGARTQTEFQEAVDKVLEENKVDTELYGILVTTSGVEVVRGWIQDGLTVKRGSKVLKIGSDFAYDAEVSGYTAGWKVLGAEDGELLIMSTADVVPSYILGDETSGEDLEKSQNDWLNGAAELDALCEPYGKGENATGARSIRIEDVEKITGFDKTTSGKGKLGEYGNEVTYSYNGTTKPAYTATNGLSSTLTYAHSNGFHFYNGTEFVHVNDLTTGTVGTTFATLKSDCYGYYYAPSLETIDETSDAYTMLFGEQEYGDALYWLASPYVNTYTDYARFGMYCVDMFDVKGWDLLYSEGTSLYGWFGVRAVVSLTADIQI